MDKAMVGNLLQQLVSADGPSGVEGEVAALAQTLAAPYVSESRIDSLGNLIALRRGTGVTGAANAQRSPNASVAAPRPPMRVMLAAHMDEIGLIVTGVERGFLRVGSVGGIDPRSVLAQEVTVYPTGSGADAYPGGLSGYIGSRPPHVLSEKDRQKAVALDDLRIDLGQPEGFFARGTVRVGDRVAIRGPYTELLGGRVATKALDNRASVAAMIASLGYLAGMQHIWDVCAVATTQEEIGLRGATTSAFGVAPDLAVAIDVTFGETPGIDASKTVPMDKGPAIGWGPNLHPGIVKRLREAADAVELPYVNEIVPGHSGTDAWAIQVTREGIPTGLISIPIRYMHSAVELVALADVDRTARLLATFIARLDADTLSSLAEEI
jgi:tetrahedral aminopeptidase